MTEDFPRDVKEAHQTDSDSTIKRKRPLDIIEEDAEETIKVKPSKKARNEFHYKPFSSHIEQNLLVLGCVKEVRDYEVIISLPDELTGKLSIIEISENYTNKLKKLAAGEFSDDDSKPLGLHDIFQVGSVVRCCITEFVHGSRKNIMLSVKPALVNQHINDFKQGMLVPGVVSSVEDHGYLVDVGHKNLKAFLPKKETRQYLEDYNSHFNEELVLSVGSYLTGLVESKKKTQGKSRSLDLSIDPLRMKTPLSHKFSLFSLLPGSLVQCTVTSTEEACVLLSMNSFQAIIFRRHLLRGPSAYQVGDHLLASVLYVQSSTKYVVLSELAHLTTPNTFFHLFKENEKGDIVEGKFVSQAANEGLYFKLPDNCRAFVKKQHVSDSKQTSLKKFVKNAVYKTRIIGFNYLERIVVLSMKKSVLNQAYYSYEDLSTGLVLECSVERLVNKGVRVKVMGRITGLIPFSHMSDIPLLKPEKTFTQGRKLKCKVLYTNADDSVLILTNKKSLVKSRHLVPCHYSDLSLALSVTGFVGSIRENGLVVVFCGEVKGWVPRDELTHGDVGKPSEMFFIGQVVQCRVLKMIPDKKKLLLTLKTSNQAVEADEKDHGTHTKVSQDVETHDKKEEVDCKKYSNRVTNLKTYLVLPTSNKFDWENEEMVNGGMEENEDLRRSFMKKMRRQLTNDEERRLVLERGTLLHPDKSLVWLELVAFEVENDGVEQARQVVQKALRTIPYRQEDEKMNIWMSYINLEFQYGSEESLKGVVDDAMKNCDQMKVMAHTRDMYESAGKMAESMEVCQTMSRKFKDCPDTWTTFGRVLYHMGESQKARRLLAESLEKVDKRHHVEVTTKFALLEAKYGMVEESERMFKGILENFPRRTDIWSVYADMLVKHSRVDEAKGALKRCSDVQMPLKKKTFILKKLANLEEKYEIEGSIIEAEGHFDGIDNF